MKKIVISLLVLAFTLVACSSATTSAPIATEAVTENSNASTSPSVVDPTQEATQSVQNTDGKILVQVTEGDNWIKSDMTTFKVGVPYVFTITNTGRHPHIFSISKPITDVSPSGIDAAKAGALAFVSPDQLFPGAVVTVEYTFTEPAPAGSLEFACLILMHYKMGQYLPIVVE